MWGLYYIYPTRSFFVFYLIKTKPTRNYVKHLVLAMNLTFGAPLYIGRTIHAVKASFSRNSDLRLPDRGRWAYNHVFKTERQKLKIEKEKVYTSHKRRLGIHTLTRVLVA